MTSRNSILLLETQFLVIEIRFYYQKLEFITRNSILLGATKCTTRKFSEFGPSQQWFQAISKTYKSRDKKKNAVKINYSICRVFRYSNSSLKLVELRVSSYYSI